MKKPTWIIFDVGGVLLDWERSSADLARFLQVPHEVLLSTMFSYAPKMNIGIVSPQEGWRLILKELDKDYDPQAIIRLWRDKKFWLKDTLKTVNDLHNAGYSLAILTNSWLGLTDETNKNLLPEELQLFEHILDSSKEGMRKPDQAFYDLLEKRIGTQGSDIYFIDDAAKNLPTAETKGWRTFHFVTSESEQANQELRATLLQTN